MERKMLFENFKQNKKIYNLNEGYWKRKLNSRLVEKFSNENVLFKNIDGMGKKIYDANPIFTYIDKSKNKAIRIIQDDINEVSQSDFDNINVFLTAWLDKIEIYDGNVFKRTDELVIAVILTRETVEKTMELIQFWLSNDMNDELIDSIIAK